MVEIAPIWIDWPRARIRRHIVTESGSVRRFVVQLEYDIEYGNDVRRDPSWAVVARFDHDATSTGGHDVGREGLHMDVYRDGERALRGRGFPRLRPGTAMRYAEEYLYRNADRLITRFERWHGIDRHKG